MDSNVDHVVVFRNSAREWCWRAVAGNGEIVAEGESHSREEDAARAVQGVFGDGVTIMREETAE